MPMRIAERLRDSRPCVSFEFFPPKTDEAVTQLFATLKDLAELRPGFVSVTYGAGGSTRQRTLEMVTAIKRETGIEAMAHLTCVGHGRGELREILRRFEAAGVENVLALRGDPPKDQASFSAAPDGLSHGSELAQFIRGEGFRFCLGGACYPEIHPDSETRDDDLANLKKKVDAGAEFLITQLFYDNAFYFHFLQRARDAGITCPIIPGIMPLTNYEQIDRITRMCGVTIPRKLEMAAQKVKSDPDSMHQLGVAHATLQCVELLRHGVPGIHFYTLNKSRASKMIVTALEAAGQL
jgi:methylenetetrahydrofolate reductase (NADPH)